MEIFIADRNIILKLYSTSHFKRLGHLPKFTTIPPAHPQEIQMRLRYPFQVCVDLERVGCSPVYCCNSQLKHLELIHCVLTKPTEPSACRVSVW